MKKTVILLFAAIAISLSANAQSAAQDAVMEEIPQAAMAEEIQEAEQSINELELVTDSPISSETEEKATSQPPKKFNPDDYKLESLDDMEIGKWNGSQYPEYIDIPNVDTILPDVNPADSYILKRQEKSSLDSTDAKAKPSRSVSIAGNQYLDVFYPGKGWIYLGETANTTLLRYFGHSISTKDTMFTLRARGTGKAILHFYKIDPLDGTSIDDYLEVTISGTSDGNSHITAPSYAETVPGKKYSPAPTETAQTESETEALSTAQAETPAEEDTVVSASTETKPSVPEKTPDASEPATATVTENSESLTKAETETAAETEPARPATESTTSSSRPAASASTSTAPKASSNASPASSTSARTTQSSAPKTSSSTTSTASPRSGTSSTASASSSSSTQRSSSSTSSTSSSSTQSARTSSSTSSTSSTASRPASSYSETPDSSTAQQSQSASPAQSTVAAPKGTAGTSKGQSKSSSGSSVIGSSADDDLLEKAQKAYSAKKYGECLEYLTEFFNNAVTRLDEGLYLQGQALEAPSDYRNIKAALETYETLVKQYPKSKKWKAANERVIYLKRFYFNIR